MCPLCLSSLVWIALGGGAGSGTLAALIIGARLSKAKEQQDEQAPDRQQ